MSYKSVSCGPQLRLLLLLHGDLVSELGSDSDLLVEEVHLLLFVFKNFLVPLKHGLVGLQVNFSGLQGSFQVLNLVGFHVNFILQGLEFALHQVLNLVSFVSGGFQLRRESLNQVGLGGRELTGV